MQTAGEGTVTDVEQQPELQGDAASAPSPSRSRRFALQLATIASLGLVWRVLFATFARRHQPLGKTTDNTWYFTAGRMIAEGWGFGNPFVWGAQHRYVPSAGHPPLYPLFLGFVSWIGAKSTFDARLAGCLLGTATIVVLGLTARELFGNRAGLVAAALAAAYPNLWINDATILSETLYVLCTSLFLWTAIRCWKKPTWGRVALMSLTVALAALTRSEAILFYPLGILPLLLRLRDVSWADRLRRVGVAAIVALVVIGPWVAYNNSGRFRHRLFIVSGSGIAMSFGNCDKTYSGQFLGYWYWTCGAKTLDKTDDETVLDASARKQAQHYIRTHLRDQPKVIAARVGRLFHLYRPSQSIVLDRYFERRGLWPSRIALFMYYPITILALVGGFVLWRRRLPVSPYVAILISAVSAAALTFGVTRYRAAFDAAAVVLAAVAIEAGLRRLRNSRSTAPEITS